MPHPSLYHKSRDRWGALPRPATVDLNEVWTALVGKIVKADEKASTRIEMNRRLDAIIARKLEAGGVACRKEAATAIVDFPLDGSNPITVREKGALENRRWQIFFGHQAAVGRETKKRLELLSQQLGKKAKYIRMGVLSYGWVPLSEVKTAIATLRKLVSQVEKIMRRYDVELLFSNIEAPLMRDDDSVVLVNLHSHILRLDHRALGSELIEMNEQIRKQASRTVNKDYFHDAGKVENLDELTKYVSKGDPAPGDDEDEGDNLERQGARKIGIEELTVSETVAWAAGMHRVKRFKPHGRAKNIWKMLDLGVTTMEEDDLGCMMLKTRKMKIASLGKNMDTGKRKLVLTPKWAVELRPDYRKNCDAAANIILGTTIRAVASEDGNQRLVGCLRVMAPSGSFANIVEHRKLGYVVELHQRVLSTALEEQAREAGLSMKHNKPVNFRSDISAQPGIGAANPPPRFSLVA